MNWPIRPFSGDDLEGLLDAWYQASLVAHPFLDEEFLTTERELIANQWIPVAETTVCEVDGRVVGFVAMNENEVGAIFVHPGHQGRGIGRALMDHARASRPFLELDVFEANPIGRRFYDAYGFKLVDSRTDDATGQSMLRLRLDEVSSG
jgi:putative acetyltransferase